MWYVCTRDSRSYYEGRTLYIHVRPNKSFGKVQSSYETRDEAITGAAKLAIEESKVRKRNVVLHMYADFDAPAW